MKIEIKGKLTAGYYNDMENGYPIFINGNSLSDIVKEKFKELGLDHEFCYGPFENESQVNNPLIGRSVTLTLNIEKDK